ncbi:uncharacterized protein LAESUDRAFT_707113 [Laetiporus sulphureus 93-53]|uniref:Transcription regulator Rua1 C-terminal domain-containing protein n=1 Tax=Laetiporus sulphureus 93-53 TaxID=1314785 RepID=A0A165BUG5_9APHY|nr:uncharacterized protein LAESUDRAFT_707113 [Laetiporus sulphureus 93-53]KZT01674.1 hypothetical protein LAESUDRAFT_707113 [Laetiporus sulphureus 93-53]
MEFSKDCLTRDADVLEPPTGAYTYSPRVFRESALRQTNDPVVPDTDPYLYQPTDNGSPFVISPRPNFNVFSPPLFIGSSIGEDLKSVFERFPVTPFQEIFASSPIGFWAAASSSVSPVVRHTSPDVDATRSKAGSSASVSERKIPSFAAYRMAQERRAPLIFGSPTRSVSSLSSLSPVSSCPSAAETPCRSQDSLLTSSSSLGKSVSRSAVHDDPDLRRPALATGGQSMSKNLSHLHESLEGVTDGVLARSRYNIRPRKFVRGSEPASKPVPQSKILNEEDPEGPVERPLGRPHKRLRLEESTKSSPEGGPSMENGEPGSIHIISTKLPVNIPRRTFPLRIPINPEFPLFYRRFAVSSYREEESESYLSYRSLSEATFNPPRGPLDLYTPRFVKGRGSTKVGLCPCCCESIARGGENKKVWLSTKFSAFNYHMQYAHGISAMTGCPFSPPIAFRTVARHNVGKHEKAALIEGKCHKCLKWVTIEGVKDIPTKVKEIYWWKHAAACHQGSTIEGECDIYLEDKVYKEIADE